MKEERWNYYFWDSLCLNSTPAVRSETAFVFHGTAVFSVINHLGAVGAEINISAVSLSWSQEGRAMTVTATSHILICCSRWQSWSFQMNTVHIAILVLSLQNWVVALFTARWISLLVVQLKQPGGFTRVFSEPESQEILFRVCRVACPSGLETCSWFWRLAGAAVICERDRCKECS